ncbi:MAG: ATP-binding protein, partial [Patescibacteria group bacterium]
MTPKKITTKKSTAKEKKPKTKKVESSYSAKDIFVLKGLEPVRKRPGMYIGTTGPDGLHHLVYEIVDNSIDEAIGGFCNEITIALLPGNKVQLTDNGRGIPVDKHKMTGKSALETIMTTLHTGGKFGGEAYKVSGGLHGVGISVVCALSKYMRVEVCRDGGRYAQEYERGKVKTKVQKLGPCRTTGTTVIFEPDETIFETVEFNFQKLLTHLRQQAYLTKGVKITISDLRDKSDVKSYVFYFEGGIVSFVKYLTRGRPLRNENIFYCSDEKEGILVETALVYTREFEFLEESFANNIYTKEGGTHLTGLRTALTRTLNDYARKNSLIKESDSNLSGQ